ncbi:MAG: hypothetical protein ACFFB0_14370 [Promethearchaeota archaeon]
MVKINEFFDKLFDFLPGYIYGLLCFIIGLTGDLLALIISGLAGDYVMWEKSISILGHRSGGIFLRGGLIISYLFSIPFIVYIGRIVKHEDVNEDLRRLAVTTGIISSITAILTGTFSGVNEFISMLHGFFALFSWMGGAIFCALFSIVMLKNPNFSKRVSVIGFIVAGIFFTYLIPFFITNFCNYYTNICYSFGRKVYIIMPTYEWIVIFSISFWYLFYASYLRYKKI